VRARQSERVALRIPIRIEWRGYAHDTCTVVVNRGGALVASPAPFPAEASFSLRNLSTGGLARVRVVWCGGEDAPGRHDMGIALAEDKPSFWGPEYEQSLTRL